MKQFSNNTLLALLAAVALQGSLASSPLGGTPRHSRLTWPRSNFSLKHHESALFGYEESLGHSQSSSVPSQAVVVGARKQAEGVERMEALGISLMLLGGVVFQMALFYLVNFPRPGIAFTTWRVLSSSCSIFISALTHHMIRTRYLSNGNRGQVQSTIFLSCYFISSFCSQFRSPKMSAVTCQAVAVVSGYVASFAAMSLCLELQNDSLFTGIAPKTGMRMIASTLLATSVFAALALFVNQARRLRNPRLDKKDAEQCEETQDSILCLCVSFLTVAVMRFYICGDIQDLEHQAKFDGVTQAHVEQVLLCGSAFAIVAALGAGARQRFLSTSAPSEGACSRMFSITLQLVTLISAWLIIFAGDLQLQLWGLESPMVGGSLMLACSLTVFGFFAILALSFVAKHTSTRIARQCLSSFELALGLLVGVSWEKYLAIAMEDITVGAHAETSNVAPHASAYLLAALLLAVGVPIWRCLILPRAMQPQIAHEPEKESLEKSLKAAAGRAANRDYGTLKEKWPDLGLQYSSPRHFDASAVLIV